MFFGQNRFFRPNGQLLPIACHTPGLKAYASVVKKKILDNFFRALLLYRRKIEKILMNTCGTALRADTFGLVCKLDLTLRLMQPVVIKFPKKLH